MPFTPPPQVPNFTYPIGRIATDRYDFEAHLEGVNPPLVNAPLQNFRHNATQVDLKPDLTIDGYFCTTVQEALEVLAGLIGSVVIPPATPTSLGGIQLAGDLNGVGTTAAQPRVGGIQGRPISSIAPTTNQVLLWNGTTWTPSSSISTTISGDVTGTTLASTVVKLQGQPIVATVPTNGEVLEFVGGAWTPSNISGLVVNLNGDVTGTTAAATVIKLQGQPISNATPAQGQLLEFDSGQWTPMTVSGLFSAGGDLTGTSTDQTVVGLQGYEISSTAPTNGQVLEYNTGTNKWTPTTIATGGFTAGHDLSGTSTSQTVIGLQGQPISATIPTDGYILEYVAGVWTPASISGVFVAGGDLSGTSNFQNVIGLQGQPISNILPTDGYVLEYVGGVWTPSPVASGSFSAGHDLSGTSTSQTVIGLQGHPISSVVPTDGYILEYVGGVWTPTAASGTFSAGGDLSGTSTHQTVIGIDGTPLDITALTTGNSLHYNGTYWVNGPVNLAGGAGYVTGTLPATNQAPQTLAGAVGGTTAASTIDLTGNTNITGILPAANQAAQSLTLIGDATSSGGTTASATTVVVKIHGATVPAAGALTTGNVLQVNGASSLTYAPINLGGGANYVTGVLPAANVAALTLAGDVTGTTAATIVSAISGASPIVITPGDLEWKSTTVNPAISQASSTGAAQNITIAPQIGVSGPAGSLILNVGTPGSGTTEAGFIFERNGNPIAKFQATIGNTGTFAIYPQVIPSATNYALQFDGTGDTTLNNTSNVYLSISGATGVQLTSSALTITPPVILKSASLEWAQTTPNPQIAQPALPTTSGNGVGGNNMEILVQAGQATTSGNGGPGGSLIIESGNGGSTDSGIGGAGGNLTLLAGNGGVGSTPNNGGNITIAAGIASNEPAAGGNVVITSGSGYAPGGGSQIQLQAVNTTQLSITPFGLVWANITITIASSGTTNLPVSDQVYPYITLAIAGGSLTGNVTFNLNNAVGIFIVDFTALRESSDGVTINLANGSATASINIDLKNVWIGCCPSANAISIG
jgi:hypothetical protein